MSEQLRIDAQVTVDATQASAGLASVAARTSDAKVALIEATRAAQAASVELTRQEAAARDAGLGMAELNAQTRPATTALVAAKDAAAAARAEVDALAAAQRAGASASNVSSGAHKANGEALLGLRTQNLELLHISKSLFDEIAAGASPFRALAVEGGRIGEVIAGSGGISKAFGGLVTLLGGPLVVAGVAAAGAAGLIALKFSNAQSEAVKLQRSLDITGNSAGLTAASVEAAGERVAAATRSSGSAATEVVTKLATSGKFTRDEIEQLGASAIGLSSRTGEATDKIVAAFVKAADGPTAYAREYAKSFVGLTAATIEHIRQLEETGQKDQALQVLSKALYEQLGTEAPGKLGFLERAWDAVAAAVGRAGKAIGDIGKTDTSPKAATNALAGEIQGKIDAITGSSRYQRGFGDVSTTSASDIARGYAPVPTLNQQLAVLRSQLDTVQALGTTTDRNTAAVAAYNATQRAGTAASAELDGKWGQIGDHVRKANDEIAKFHNDVKVALAANPNDPTALEDQKNSAKIEADIRKKYEPDATAAATKAKTAAEAAAKLATERNASLAESIAKLEAEANLVSTIGETGKAELKILDLQKAAHRELSALERERVTNAIELKDLADGLRKTLVENTKLSLGGNPSTTVADAFARDDSARKKEIGTPGSLASFTEGLDQAQGDAYFKAQGHNLGESAGQQFATTAPRIGELIGDAAGGKLGSIVTRSLESYARRAAADPNGASPFLSTFQDSFKQANKALTDKLGDIFGSGSGGFGATAGKAFAGASQGQLAGSVLGALGVKTSGAGSEIGGAIGALIPALGPFGGIIGGAIGGVLGGLFGKKATSGSDVLTSATANGTVTGTGSIQQTAAKGLGTQVQNGLDQIAQSLGGSLGSFSPITIGQRNDNYRVDTTGATIGKYNGKDFGTGDAAAAAAVTYAVETAIQRGAITGLSAKVQAVITEYGDDLNKAVAEALKVKGLEDLIANAANPFSTAFRDFELQAKQRVEVAKQYGFDVVAIEKINADQRAKLIQDTLTNATASVQSAIDDLKFGSRATGSIDEQRTALTTERDRLTGLVQGGDSSQLGALTSIVQQLVDLDKQAFGSTAGYATSRDNAVSLLDSLVQQTSDKINAAATAAQTPDATAAAAAATTDPSVAALTELNATGDDQVALQRSILDGINQLNLNFTASSGSPSSLSALYARANLQ